MIKKMKSYKAEDGKRIGKTARREQKRLRTERKGKIFKTFDEE